MASITIRNLPDEDKQKLRERAAKNGRSMEAEVRAIIQYELCKREHDEEPHFVDQVRALFEPLGGMELPEIKREPMREPPDFK